MKNLIILFRNSQKFIPLAFLSLILHGCNGSENQIHIQKINPQQKAFLSRLDIDCSAYSKISNEIEKQEAIESFEKKGILGFVDSAGLMIEWIGILNSFEINSVPYTFKGKSNLIGLDLKIVLKKLDSSKVKRIYFESLISIDKEDKDTLLVYNQLKKLAKGDTIIFDGFIQKNKNKEISFGTGDNNPCSSQFSFFPVSIKKASTSNEYSAKFVELRKNLIQEKIKYELGQSQRNKFKQSLLQIYNSAKSLSNFEKDYINSFIYGIGFEN